MMKPRLPLTAGVLSWGLGVVGVDVVRLLAGAVRAGLNCLRVVDDTHSTDLRGHNNNIGILRIMRFLKLTDILLAASCLMGGVGVTVTPGGMLGLVV